MTERLPHSSSTTLLVLGNIQAQIGVTISAMLATACVNWLPLMPVSHSVALLIHSATFCNKRVRKAPSMVLQVVKVGWGVCGIRMEGITSQTRTECAFLTPSFRTYRIHGAHCDNNILLGFLIHLDIVYNSPVLFLLR